MRWSNFLVLLLVVGCFGNEKDRKLSSSRPPAKLDDNLRQALLKALTELENEQDNQDHADRIVTRASASSVSIIADDQDEPANENNKEPVEISTPSSKSVRPLDEPEQFLTSASSSFTSSNKVPHEKSEDASKKVKDEIKLNTVSDSPKTTVATTKRPTSVRSTTPATTTSTEENEAKVEDVQFFSAPLVAAFTVHQDERGLPKHVEPIYKTVATQVKTQEVPKNQPVTQQVQETSSQQKLRQQLLLQERQKALEQEILRLKLIQQQQELILRQQIEKEKLLQEELKLRDIGLHFTNILNSKPQQNLISSSLIPQQNLVLSQQNLLSSKLSPQQNLISSNLITPNAPAPQQNLVTSNLIAPSPTASPPTTTTSRPIKKEIGTNNINDNSVSLQQSIAIDPLIEAGKLPLNGQILPVRNPNNFHAPLIQTPTFTQYHSIAPQNIPFIRNFQPLVLNPTNGFPDITFTTPSSVRVFRQEANVGNFLNNRNNFNSGPSITIQKSIPHENKFVRTNFLNTLATPNSFSIVPSIETDSSFQVNRFNGQPIQHNRFFRSNYERVVPQNNQFNQQLVDRQLNNLLYNSGLIRGNAQQEHLGIISKVLSLNHNTNYAPITNIAN